MIQYIVIAAIVGWAILFSAWSVMPAGTRRSLAQRAARWARRAGLAEKQAQGLQARLEQSGSCSACSTCQGCGKPATPAKRPIPENDRQPH